MKKWISTVVLIVLATYVVVAVVAFSDKPANQVCRGVRLSVSDSAEVGYMTARDVEKILSDLNPEGKFMDEVSCRAMEQLLDASPLIRKSECYKTIDGYVGVNVECRYPILRIITAGGDSYYLDAEGEVIEYIPKAVYLPIATGYISREFAQNELLALAQYLHENELWNAQVEQIHVTPRQEIELVPRVGNHVIVLGRPVNYVGKFESLKLFYKKALSEVGWSRYSRINVDYNNQVVGTKR